MTTISLCVIARDEAALLPRLLDSVAGAVDDVVVVDTGSRDRTAEIARERGARVFHHAFRDDFADARNRSLEEALGDWILVLDADEVLEPGAGPALRAAVEDNTACGYYLTFDNDRGGGRIQRCAMMRLFRADPAIRFDYVIHEQVVPALLRHARRTGQRLLPLPAVRVFHDGYLPSRYAERGKAERNRLLFERQVQRYPDHIYSWYKYGDFLRQFDDRRDDAITALLRAAELLRRIDPAEARGLSFPSEVFALLGVDLDRRGETRRSMALVEEGLARFGATPNLLYVHGHLLAKEGRHREAFVAYARLRAFHDVVLPNPAEPGVTGPIAWHGMARALANLGYRTASRRCFELALAHDPTQDQARLGLARALLEVGDAKGAAAQYRAIVERTPGQPEVRLRLAATLLHLGEAKAAEQELATALDEGGNPLEIGPRLGQARLAQGDLEGALGIFAETPDQPTARAGIRILNDLSLGRDPWAGAGADEPSTLWRNLVRAGCAALAERVGVSH